MNIRKSLLVAFLGLTIVALSPNTACAQVLYDNGSPITGSIGYYADTDNEFGVTMSGIVFNPTSSGAALAISFAGEYYGGSLPSSDHFTVTLYSSISGGLPDTSTTPAVVSVTDVTRTALGIASSGNTVYQFTGLLSAPLTLTIDTPSYIGITDSGDGEDFALTLALSPQSTNIVSYFDAHGPGSTFYVSNGDSPSDGLSIQLMAPEPSEWALFLMGIVMLLLVGKFRQRAVTVTVRS